MATATHDQVPREAGAAAAPATQEKKKSSRARIVAPIVLVFAATIGLGYWMHQRHFEDTDDAQVDGSISNVSPRVGGTIKAVYVSENQRVEVGQVLAEIDTADLEVALAQAKAAVAQAEAQLKAEDPTVSMTETSNTAAVANASSDLSSSIAAVGAAKKEVDQLAAQLAQAEANNKQAQQDKERAAKLLASSAISQADFDQRANTAAAAEASVHALEQALAAAKDRVAEANARVVAAQSKLSEVKTNAPMQVETKKASVTFREASLELARAQLQQAQLNVQYAKIVAPIAGIVGRKSVSIGDHVAPGQQLLAIAATDGLYVTANFRETQLENIQVGQSVDIHVDALDLDLHGKVESLGGATGAKFSVLPPENASGNYVKVVQRIPVRIAIDPGQSLDRLRAGMSVEPVIKVR
jgi:membrane fusion protein (multidrug efflux system)